jgi:hypothetical protein
MSELLKSPVIEGTLTQHQAGHGPTLLLDTPILAVRDGIRADIGALSRLAPGSDNLAALRDLEARLNAAIVEGRNADAWVDTEEAARLRKVTQSAITKACRKGQLRARKKGGLWQVHKDALSEAA